MSVSLEVAKILADIALKSGESLFSSKDAEKTLEERKTILVQQLMSSGIDPAAFDVLIANEINRKLKTQFGVVFLVFTFLFTAASYAIVVLDGALRWGISPMAITALVVETPIQFVGLLYVIARNLFPHYQEALPDKRSKKKTPNSRPSSARKPVTAVR